MRRISSEWVPMAARRFLQAYSEGLMMTCPLHRAGDMTGTSGANGLPAAIDQPQDDVRSALRPEFAVSFDGRAFSSVRH